jgi:hypothetical protein
MTAPQKQQEAEHEIEAAERRHSQTMSCMKLRYLLENINIIKAFLPSIVTPALKPSGNSFL